MSKILDVYLSGALAGRLVQTDAGRLEFTYDPGWVGSPHAASLSQSLQLRAEPFDHDACRPFFAGLLPEGELRTRIAAVVGISARNDFAFLEQLGGECAGAVTLLPEGAPYPKPEAFRSRPLDEHDLAEVLRRLPGRPLLAGEAGVRLSLAGAQAKIAVLVEGDRLALPLDGAPSSHIVKAKIAGFPDTVRNEAFCLRLARRLDLSAVDAAVGVAEDEPYLLVTRYDRIRSADHGLVRLHQEDFCQALARPPELKYQSEGGPTLADCFALVRRTSTRPAIDLMALLDAVVFNALVGNHDAHAKNYSLVYTRESAALAPLYDVVSTVVYPELSTRLAMRIGGQPELARVMPRHWDRMAEATGLAAPALKRRVAALAERAEAEAERAAEELAAGQRSPVVDQCRTAVCARARGVLENLARGRG
jgi:serine/threonine-protein kinase HipA